MAEKAFFYNALPDESSVTGYDRNYNADDLSDWLATVWETGVVKSDDGLKVVASSGMTVNVNAGKACILGKPYNNTSIKALTVGTAPTGSTARYDLVVLQYNNETSTRKTRLLIKQTSLTGLSTDDAIANTLIRSGKIFEICLAVIAVQPNATSITQSSIHDKRGNALLCPWFTAVKGYEDYYDAMVQTYEYTVTLPSSNIVVQTNIASRLYNDKYSQIEVFTNGLKEPSSAYHLATNGSTIVITFTSNKASGAVINVVLNNYIDGEGMSTALASYNQWVNAVETLQTAFEYDYMCNGVNDNILISNIAQAFANDSSISDGARLTINVHGSFGATSAQGGDGTSSSNYRWLSIGTATTSEKRITVDFSKCREVNIPVKAGTHNTIIFGSNTHVKGLNLKANCTGLDCHVRVFFNANGGEVTAEDCYFESVTTGTAFISKGGTFINCKGYMSSANSHAYCFLMESNNSPIVVLGGKYRAYTASADTSIISAVVYASASASDAVCVLHGVNCPTVGKSSFYQKNAVRVNSGYLTASGLITALSNNSASGATVSMTGTIPISKA